MDTETMIRNLKKVEDDHKDDKIFTGKLNIAEMAHDVRKRLEELKPYEDTGLTPEQIRELKARDTPKEAIYEAYGDQGDGEDPDAWICPNCEAVYDIDDDYDFCPDCGQMILR